jgi:hypothetical protein
MNVIELEFKGETKKHIVLNPVDIASLQSIFTFSKNALRGVGPWGDKTQHETYAKTIEWMENLVNLQICSPATK